MRRKISTTVYLEIDQLESLKQLVEATGIPMAVMIREAVDREIQLRWARVKRREYLKRKRRKAK